MPLTSSDGLDRVELDLRQQRSSPVSPSPENSPRPAPLETTSLGFVPPGGHPSRVIRDHSVTGRRAEGLIVAALMVFVFLGGLAVGSFRRAPEPIPEPVPAHGYVTADTQPPSVATCPDGTTFDAARWSCVTGPDDYFGQTPLPSAVAPQ